MSSFILTKVSLRIRSAISFHAKNVVTMSIKNTLRVNVDNPEKYKDNLKVNHHAQSDYK